MSPESDSSRISISEWLYVSTGLVWATRREVETTFLDIEFFTNNHIIAWLVTRGRVTLRVGSETVTAGPGSWIFPGSRKGHQRIQPGTIILSLKFFAEWPTGRSLFDHKDILVFRAADEPELTGRGEALESEVRRVAQRNGFFLLGQETADVESYFAIRQAFESWMLAYVRTMLRAGRQPSVMASADRRVLRAARLLDTIPLRRPFRESELAQAVGLSVSQLNRLFARDLGFSPRKYLDRRRLHAAFLLLQNDRRSVKETAYELGFNSLPHFSSWFHRQHGISPRAFQSARS